MSTSTSPAAAHSNPSTGGSRTLSSGVMLAILGTFLFALKSIFIKLSYAAGVGPTSLLALRMAFSLPFYVVVLVHVSLNILHDSERNGNHGGAARLTRSMVARALGLGFLGYYLASYLDLCGLAYISAQLERLTLFTYPALISVLAWMFLGERMTWKIVTAVLLCYAGVVLMYFGEQTLSAGTNVRMGVALVMGSAVSYSVYVLFAKPTIQEIGSQAFTSLAMIGSTFFVLVHFLCTESIADILSLDKVVYFYAVVLAFVCTVVPSFMINEAIVRIGAARTSIIGSVGPVLTMGLAIGILGEPSSLRHFFGMAVAVVGLSFVAKK